MKITSASFVTSAFQPSQEPKGPGPDVVFMGRSNVGKSSLINRLLGTKGLARTSSTPGRTQSVNFYRINDRFWFVDLPGYGYARVPAAVREQWRPMIEGFLASRRDRIAMAVLLVDARHEPTQMDRTMREWLQDSDVPYLVAATKADKLSGNGRARAARTVRQAMAGTGRVGEPVLTSAQTGLGIRDIWKHLDDALIHGLATSGKES